MKKLLLAMVMLALVTSLGFAGNAFNKGDKTAHVGIGIGLGGLYGTSDFPPISASFEYGIEPKIGIGGIIGYASSSESYAYGFGYSYKWKYTYIIVGARGNYHFLEDNEKVDAYAGVTLGYDIVSSSVEETGTTPIGFGRASASSSYALFGGQVGIRYYISPKFGIFGEAGYGVGYITGGVCFRL